MNLAIAKEVREGTLVVRVDGDLDVYTAPQLRQVLSEALSGDAHRLIVDLSAVHFIDSTALGVLASARQQSLAAQSELGLVMVDPHLLKIFRITGFDGVFSIYPTVAQAVSRDAAS